MQITSTLTIFDQTTKTCYHVVESPDERGFRADLIDDQLVQQHGSNPTTCTVTLVMEDGSVCEDQITLIPIGWRGEPFG